MKLNSTRKVSQSPSFGDWLYTCENDSKVGNSPQSVNSLGNRAKSSTQLGDLLPGASPVGERVAELTFSQPVGSLTARQRAFNAALIEAGWEKGISSSIAVEGRRQTENNNSTCAQERAAAGPARATPTAVGRSRSEELLRASREKLLFRKSHTM